MGLTVNPVVVIIELITTITSIINTINHNHSITITISITLTTLTMIYPLHEVYLVTFQYQDHV